MFYLVMKARTVQTNRYLTSYRNDVKIRKRNRDAQIYSRTFLFLANSISLFVI